MKFLQIHPKNPQARLIEEAADMIREGAVAVYPTDSAYAIGCHLSDKDALERIRRIRQINDKHHMTLMCRDLSELGTYAKLDNNHNFRLVKSHTPGPYTFLLKATKEVPKRLMHPKRKSIGIRIPDNQITLDLLQALDEPMMSTSLIMPGDVDPLSDPDEIKNRLGQQVDIIIDGGFCGHEPTSIIDLYHDQPEIIREGQGDISDFSVNGQRKKPFQTRGY